MSHKSNPQKPTDSKKPIEKHPEGSLYKEPKGGHGQKEIIEKVSALLCTTPACKRAPKRFEFCDEHYEHFKFGLIKKNGQPAADYAKKKEQFLAHQKKHAPPIRKVA